MKIIGNCVISQKTINNYTSLGIELGNANEKILNQINILETAIKISCNKFDQVILKSETEKDIIN